MIPLIAQVPTDPLSGGAGWVGAGLLGLVLCWLLLKHLPDKDRQQRELIDAHLVAEANQRTDHAKAEKEQRTEHAIQINCLVENFRKELSYERQLLSQAIEKMSAVSEDLSDLINHHHKTKET